MESTDPLPSWREGPAKAAIVDFVARVTRSGAEFVPPVERIAAFDHDGTLWCERPIQAQVYLLADRVRELAVSDPELAERHPYRALLELDLAALTALGKEALQELLFATHAGMTMRDFATMAHRWQAAAHNPALGRRFVDLVYQPQLELLAYLQAHAFSCFIVTAGGVDFVRAVAEARYGIPPEQVIGSSCRLQFDHSPRGLCVYRLADLRSFNDRECKIENIGLHIGRRPILACGNSDGDLPMLRYIAAGPGPRLALLVHHDDAAREFAYDREFAFSPLAEALERAADCGIRVVSMARDWAAVFPDAPAP